jgi:hypothetical protein
MSCYTTHIWSFIMPYKYSAVIDYPDTILDNDSYLAWLSDNIGDADFAAIVAFLEEHDAMHVLTIDRHHADGKLAVTRYYASAEAATEAKEAVTSHMTEILDLVQSTDVEECTAEEVDAVIDANYGL